MFVETDTHISLDRAYVKVQVQQMENYKGQRNEDVRARVHVCVCVCVIGFHHVISRLGIQFTFG